MTPALDTTELLESLQRKAVRHKRSRPVDWAKTRLSLGLGLLMLTFGCLKFVNPTIDGWFHVQIQQSHLPHSAILMGKIAEIVTGILFLLPRFWHWPAKSASRILLVACSSLFLVMLVAVYVHLQPGVPPQVLPLGIKPPVIPLSVLLLGVMVAIPAWKDSGLSKRTSAPNVSSRVRECSPSAPAARSVSLSIGERDSHSIAIRFESEGTMGRQ